MGAIQKLGKSLEVEGDAAVAPPLLNALRDYEVRPGARIHPPRYILHNSTMDLSPVVLPEHAPGYTGVDVLRTWPAHGPFTSLDESQFDAVRAVLTQGGMFLLHTRLRSCL